MLGKIIELFRGALASHPTYVAQYNKTADINEDIDNETSCIELAYDEVSWTEIDQSFTGLMLGVNSLIDDSMCKAEKSMLDLIRERHLLYTIPEYMVPRLPTMIPKIMMELHDQDADANSLAKIMLGDMALVGEVISLANSAYYGRSRIYESLEQAICNIGFNGIRQMIFSAALKPILSTHTGHFTKISSRYIWDKSMYTGLLSDRIARSLGEDRFHAYLAGLILQSGMIVLTRELDKCFDAMEAPRNRRFFDALNRYSYDVSARIGKQWQFPEEVTSAIQEQATCDNPLQMSNLGQITYLCDKLAKARTLLANGHMKTFHGDVSKLIKGDMHNVYLRCYKQLNIDLQHV